MPGRCCREGGKLAFLSARISHSHLPVHKPPEELAGRRLSASLEQLEEERQDNAYDKAGFLSFMEFGGFDLRQDGVY